MEAYARCFGCDLIIDPRISGKKQGVVDPSGLGRSQQPVARKNTDALRARSEATLSPTHAAARTILRIRPVIQFIEDYLHDDRVRVVIPATPGQITTNLIIVGDWFAAEAVVPHYRAGGYERTLFTRHAPTVLNMIARFNQDIEDRLREAGWDPGRTDTTRKAKAAALKALRTSLSDIMKGL
jgi:hypothetical protein